MTRYTVTYAVQREEKPQFPEHAWSVKGTVKDEQGTVVMTDDLTAHYTKEWCEEMYTKYFSTWNTDPKFCQRKSGDRWRDKILP